MSDLYQVQLHKTTQYTTKQPKYANLPSTPFRTYLIAPSNSGKTTLIIDWILRGYRGCFERVFIFSPSVFLDNAFIPAIKYLQTELGQNQTEQPFLFDTYDEKALENIVHTQTELIKFQKKNKMKSLFNIFVVIDDFSDDPRFVRNSKLLHGLFTRGRHSCINVLISCQFYKAASTIIRKNLSCLIIFRLKNLADKDAWQQELSALVEPKLLEEMYQSAIKYPYGYLQINLASSDVNYMFYNSVGSRYAIKNEIVNNEQRNTIGSNPEKTHEPSSSN